MHCLSCTCHACGNPDVHDKCMTGSARQAESSVAWVVMSGITPPGLHCIMNSSSCQAPLFFKESINFFHSLTAFFPAGVCARSSHFFGDSLLSSSGILLKLLHGVVNPATFLSYWEVFRILWVLVAPHPSLFGRGGACLPSEWFPPLPAVTLP